ncbi:hypothetical protein [Subtercola boreus]|uniref:hypothetical protein n=1 Tax=Subtercola boreus TaxID=120213 RepID=UPI0011C0493E|nr:hypothetical protein [Subtercola boreus]
MPSSPRHRSSYHSPRRTWLLSGATGLVVGLSVGAIVALSGVVLPGETAHADDSSAVTVKASDQDADIANAPAPDLAVTISQTRGLVSQGLTISWTGGKKSELPSTITGGADFLQIAQCWGDDPASSTPSPDRTTCQYGGFSSPGASRDNYLGSIDDVAPQDMDYTVPSTNFAVPTYTSIPFHAVTGETVASVKDGVHDETVDVNQNPFFTKYTTNEVKWIGSGDNGTGSAKFEVQTALQAPGLGCGAPVTSADGGKSGRACWLVIIPRGEKDPGSAGIDQSGLFYDTWKHRIAVKLSFNPLGVNCPIGAAERPVAGSELVAAAVASWQPALCNAAGGSVYSISTGADTDAAAAANGTTLAPLALTSLPLSAEASGGVDNLTYAPVALGGLSIGFAIDRVPSTVEGTPQTVIDSAGLPFSSLKLTPRLLAKLLTNSYIDSLPTGADRSHVGYKSPEDQGKNARNLTRDPDFLAVNDPEWQFMNVISPSVADLLEPQGRSDAATQLWNYVLSDPTAVAFLNGEPDEWGMIVNPWSSTNDKVVQAVSKNTDSRGLALPRDTFPKTDPIDQKATDNGGEVNLVTWRPYVNDLDTGAYLTLRGDGQTLGQWNPTAATPKYDKSVRSLPGQQSVLGLTDTSSAARYQVVSAELQNPAGKFVAPTIDSLTAAAAAMTAAPAQPQVYTFDPTSDAAKQAPTAYPLAMPVYAAVNRTMSDPALRADYAAFIRYAATDGQTPGDTLGQLPKGYAPIPSGWQAQALVAADTIESGLLPVPPVPEAPNAPVAPAGSALTPAQVQAGVAVVRPARGVSAPAPAAIISAPATTVGPTGKVAAPLLGPATPADPAGGPISAAVPASLLAGLGAAGLVPFLSRTRRRS